MLKANLKYNEMTVMIERQVKRKNIIYTNEQK